MIDLKQFCGVSSREYGASLKDPFTEGAYSYGSDGAIIVRVPRRSSITRAALVKAGRLWKWAFPRKAKWSKLPDLPSTLTDNDVVLLGHRAFRGRYLKKIAALPQVKVAVRYGGPEDGMAFRFNGGAGLLMPLSSGCEITVKLRKSK